jgi:hypothetical protein
VENFRVVALINGAIVNHAIVGSWPAAGTLAALAGRTKASVPTQARDVMKLSLLFEFELRLVFFQERFDVVRGA